MAFIKPFLTVLVAATAVFAAGDPGARLTKPPLRGDLNYVEAGLEAHLPPTAYSLRAWNNGYIPAECKQIVTGGVVSSVNYRTADVTVFDVTYSDCGSPWIFCHHNNAPISIDTMATTFGRLPIQMREYIRHVITLPDPGAWAFEWDGSVTFLGAVPNLLSVVIHETGHSLDLNGAYADKSLSASEKWWSEYNQDSKVPDNYAQTNAIEDVAQNTVIATFDVNVPNGFGSIEPNYGAIFRQFATVITEAREAGNGNSIIKPGKGATCQQRLPASSPTPKSANARALGQRPDTSLPAGIKAIDNSHREDKDSGCRLHLH